VRYSFTGAITEPRQVLRGGYLSWHDPATDEWWQEQFFGDQPEFINLGKLTGQGSLRAQIERKTNVLSLRSMVRDRGPLLSAARSYRSHVERPSEIKAAALRAYIERLKKPAAAPEESAAAPQPEIRRPPRRGRQTGGDR
jgi:hypothetical protein